MFVHCEFATDVKFMTPLAQEIYMFVHTEPCKTKILFPYGRATNERCRLDAFDKGQAAIVISNIFLRKRYKIVRNGPLATFALGVNYPTENAIVTSVLSDPKRKCRNL